MKRNVMVGLSVLAGAALFEAALVPGLVIGGAAILAPRYLTRLRRRQRPAFGATARRRTAPAHRAPTRGQAEASPQAAVLPRLGIKQAIAKAVTFRIIVTTLDFTTNYVVIGELTTAAGLSAFNLVAGPLFYLGHEAAWNYFGPAEGPVDISAALPLQSGANTLSSGRGGLMISRALAKTITFRTIATVVDFTTNYVVVGDVVTAASLSAFAFVVGPFVYLGHEKVWDYCGSPRVAAADVPASKSLVTA
jgi:uncharacterized membrane protein